jgi:hypothetical protein
MEQEEATALILYHQIRVTITVHVSHINFAGTAGISSFS